MAGPFVVAGHSLGCLVAIRLAGLRPDLVSSVVGFGPPLFRSASDARRQLRHLGALEALFALDSPTAEVVCEWVCDHRALAARLAGLVRPDLPPAITDDSVQHTWPSYRGTLRNLLLSGEHRQWVDDVRCPLRLIVGDRDRVADRVFLEELARDMPAFSLTPWPGGHDLPLSEPFRCAEVVLDEARALAGRG